MSTTGNQHERHWFKSSYSRDSSSCVSVSLDWVKSTFSRDSSNCVQVRQNADTVLIRDDKYIGEPTDEPIIVVPVGIWNDFLSIVADEEVATGTIEGIPEIIRTVDGSTTLRGSNGQTLTFTADEWTAFTKGVQAGEFTSTVAA
ncbi:DUF397 domain-containing protein [Nocardia terpenica]|uniref:DUF397 domain-containing protein n=1 Tax=Nocardia terpenica TaxID=455432 RepID=A0A164IUS9_9NOCA|nr:DUF397 domain-containing protein [Nocardia terpenica]KZM69765.1 hypothetical protein AWN90_06995 [Nocardia terpenica]NQE89457.1 DUF397 domain-containing protein [Nocardia terpenica]